MLPKAAVLLQVLREHPPGYGGVERVAHELAQYFGGITLSLVQSAHGTDPLPVTYRRCSWRTLPLGRLRLFLPLPEPLRLLRRRDSALLLHLPCPSIVVLGWLVRLLQPGRKIHLYWHAFLEQRRWWFRVYELLALGLARQASTVISTSPDLLQLLRQRGISESSLVLLPPALSEWAESCLTKLSPVPLESPLRVLSIGRLDSYKRQDWLIQAIAAIPHACLTVLGCGPDQQRLMQLGAELGLTASGRLRFTGRVSELAKAEALDQAQVLVLASDSCHEAFGIVQLEAMAAGRVALCMQQSRSGVAWVNGLRLQPHHPCRSLADLVAVLQRFSAEPELLRQCASKARLRYEQVFSRVQWQRRCDSLAPRLGLLPTSPSE